MSNQSANIEPESDLVGDAKLIRDFDAKFSDFMSGRLDKALEPLELDFSRLNQGSGEPSLLDDLSKWLEEMRAD